MIIPYNNNLKEYAKELRKNATLSEILLWNGIKSRRISGYQFLRQKPLLNYIVDFYCPKLKLAIEVDGISHEFKVLKDIQRQQELEKYGIKFIRFADEEVKKNPEGAVITIEKWIRNNS